jgi:hypothetical protein
VRSQSVTDIVDWLIPLQGRLRDLEYCAALFKDSTSIRIEREHSGSSIRYYLNSSQFAGLPDTQIYAVAGKSIATINKALESRPVIMGLPITILADGSRHPLTVVTSDQGLSLEHLSSAVTDTPAPTEVHASYPQILLAQARRFIDADHFGMGIVLAHTACEVATEQAMSQAFSTKGIQSLEDAVMRFLNGYNLATDRIRALYTALTDDNITLPSGFNASSQRRNRIVHGGAAGTKQEAEESYIACSDVVIHILRWQRRMPP